MAQALKFGNGTWATKTGSSMAYNDQNGNYKPLPFNFERDSIATRVNKEGLIEVVGRDIPRIDYTDSSDGVLLLEPSRTNSLLQSNQFDTTWGNTNTTVLGGQSGIYGSSDAWKIDISSAFAQVEQTISNNGVQTFSVYAKAGTLNWVRLRVDHTSFSGTYFDLQNGEVGTTVGDISSSIEDVGGGWYRCNLSVDNNVTRVRIYPSIANNDLSATSGNIYIQHAQLEQGSYATSYIPTNGSSVQREADVANGSGNSEVFNDSEGVLFADISFLDSNVSAVYQLSLSDGSGNNRIMIYPFSDNQLGLRFNANTVQLVSQTIDVQNLKNYSKLAIKWNSNNYSIYQNGFEVYSQSITDTPIGLDRINFGSVTNTNNLIGETKEITYYDAILTDSELEYLTSYRSLSEMVTELNLNTL